MSHKWDIGHPVGKSCISTRYWRVACGYAMSLHRCVTSEWHAWVPLSKHQLFTNGPAVWSRLLILLTLFDPLICLLTSPFQVCCSEHWPIMTSLNLLLGSIHKPNYLQKNHLFSLTQNMNIDHRIKNPKQILPFLKPLANCWLIVICRFKQNSKLVFTNQLPQLSCVLQRSLQILYFGIPIFIPSFTASVGYRLIWCF